MKEKNPYSLFKEKVYSMFPDISKEEYLAFEEIFTLVTYPKKTILCKPGRVATELYFVNNGSLRLFYETEGIERTLFFAFENQFTGPCRSFMLGEHNHQIFETLEGCELLVVKKEPFLNALAKFPRLALLRSIIAEENLFITENIVSFLLLNSPEERYKNLLAHNPKILERVPQYLIASYLGISPISLSRIRKRIITKK
jgi:CRP-like cAMP-binding protein